MQIATAPGLLADTVDPEMIIVISLLSLAAAIGVPLFVYLKERRGRGLAYEVSVATLASVHRKARSRIRVEFAGRPVERLALVTLRIRNSGREPIAARDFHTPLTIELDGDATIVDYYVGERQPEDLEPALVATKHGLASPPLLLNPGDRFEIVFLVDGAEVDVQVSARVAGVRRLEREPSGAERADATARKLRRFGWVVAAAVAVAASAVFAAALGEEDNSGPPAEIQLGSISTQDPPSGTRVRVTLSELEATGRFKLGINVFVPGRRFLVTLARTRRETGTRVVSGSDRVATATVLSPPVFLRYRYLKVYSRGKPFVVDLENLVDAALASPSVGFARSP